MAARRATGGALSIVYRDARSFGQPNSCAGVHGVSVSSPVDRGPSIPRGVAWIALTKLAISRPMNLPSPWDVVAATEWGVFDLCVYAQLYPALLLRLVRP